MLSSLIISPLSISRVKMLFSSHVMLIKRPNINSEHEWAYFRQAPVLVTCVNIGENCVSKLIGLDIKDSSKHQPNRSLCSGGLIIGLKAQISEFYDI